MKLTQSKWYPWILVVSYSLLGVGFPAAVTQFSMAVPDMARQLGVSRQTVLLADSLRAVCLVCALFLSGYAYRRLGLRKTMVLGLVFQIAPQFLLPAAVEGRSLVLFFMFKGTQGLNAVGFPLYIVALTMWTKSRYTALNAAIFNGSFVAGSGIGAWLSGYLIPRYGWRTSFYAVGAFCLVFAVPAILLTRDREGERPLENASGGSRKGVYGSIIRRPVTWLLVGALLANTWVSQAVTVDMSVYAESMGYTYSETGKLMLLISVITVLSSILAGGISDYAASRAGDRIQTRCRILILGYILSMASSFALPFWAELGFLPLALASCTMMFGVSWAAGVFWALPKEIYSGGEQVAGTAFCSGASNIPNPIAPMVVGVLLGTNGFWGAGWFTCGFVSLISALSAAYINRNKY